MFLAGLKFALGLVVGLLLIAGIFMLSLVATDLLASWRKRRQHRLDTARVRARKHVMPQMSTRVAFSFRFCTDDWVPVPDKSKYLQ
jgi:hypothetical protein